MALISFISLRRLGYFWEKVKEYIQHAIQPSGDDKEVVNVLTACTEDDPYPENPQEGDKVIDLSDSTLMEYTGSSWTGITPDESVIYLTADTSHIYVYNVNEGWKDVTGEPVDNTIYISDLSGLDEITDNGVYNVVRQNPGIGAGSTAYTLVVYTTQRMMRPRGFVIIHHQILSNNSGWMYRSKSGELLWSEWEYHTYMTVEEYLPSIEERLNRIEKIAKAGVVL